MFKHQLILENLFILYKFLFMVKIVLIRIKIKNK